MGPFLHTSECEKPSRSSRSSIRLNTKIVLRSLQVETFFNNQLTGDQGLKKIVGSQAQTKEQKLNQLFVFVRNSGFDKLREMISVNASKPNAFPQAKDIKGARDPQGNR